MSLKTKGDVIRPEVKKWAIYLTTQAALFAPLLWILSYLVSLWIWIPSQTVKAKHTSFSLSLKPKTLNT